MSALERLFFSPPSARGIVAARIIVVAHALWIVLSRPSLWSVNPPRDLALRFGWLFDVATERVLFIVLVVAIALALFSRVASLAAAVLLYHFAPLEEALAHSGDPFMYGLTADVLALAVLAFVPRVRNAEPSGDFRWPIVLIRFAVAAPYLFSLVAKGIGWFTGSNIANVARTFDLIGVAPAANLVIDHPVLAWLIAIGWLLVSIGMPIAVVSRRVARFVVPIAALAHLAAIPLFGVIWLATPLLLLFVDYSATPNSSAHRASA
ncbi:MAG: hypothetical protein JWO97_412 [Acidobacteria bacterium]|nr:hypothetical protein [Acidobacteriota bacterium]